MKLDEYGAPPLMLVPSVHVKCQPTSLGLEPDVTVIVAEKVCGEDGLADGLDAAGSGEGSGEGDGCSVDDDSKKILVALEP